MLDLDKELGLAPPTSAAVKPPSAFDLDKELGIGAPVEVGGLRAAAKQMVGQTIKGAGQAAADFIPGVTEDNGLRRYGQEMVEANPTKVQGLTDIVDNPWTAVKEAAGNALPAMGGILGLRAAGQGLTALSPLAGPAAPLVAGAGQALSWGGPLVLAALPSYSGIRDTQTEGGAEGTAVDKALALGGSAAVGAIELAGGPQARLMIKAMTGGLKREAGESLAKAVGKTALKSGAEETGEELVQNPIEQLASYQDPTTAKNIEETLFGGAMGFIGGGVLGGGMQAVGGQKDLAEKDPIKETTEAVQARTLSEIVGAPATTVKNGQAYISIGEGEFITAPIEKVTEHFLNGGTLENFDTAMATKDSLDKLAAELDSERPAVDLAYLINLRNVDQGLIQAGVNRKDIDALILSRVQDTPGRKEYIAQLLASGKPDPTAIKEIATGEITDLNAPLQAEWLTQDQARAARETNLAKLQAIQTEGARVKEALQRRGQLDEERRRDVDNRTAIRAALEAARQEEEEGYNTYNPEPPVTPTLNRQSLEANSGRGLPVTPQESVLRPVPATPAEQRAERLGTYREMFSRSTQPAQDIQATITRFETNYADNVTETNSLLAQGFITEAQARAEKEQAYRELFKNTDLTPQEIAANIQSLESNLQPPITQQQSVMPSTPTTPAQERAEQFGDYIDLFGRKNKTAAPAGTPPSEMASPSISAQPSPAGAAPQQTETLNALAPWDVGPIQPREAVDAIVQATAPDVRYDGATLDLHGFTVTLPDGRQPSFSIKGEVTSETLSKVVNDVKGRFGILDSLSTRRDFLKRGGALVAWAAAGGDVTQLMASSNDFAAQVTDKNQTVSGLLKWVQANSGSEKFKTLAKDLIALIPNNRTILLNTANLNPGVMGTATVDRKGRTITISLNEGRIDEATFLHEAIHAAVMARYDSLSNYIANKGSLSGKNADPVLQRYQQVWGEFRDAVKAYAKDQGQPISALPTWLREPFSKPDEFMTYALTDENLQEFLASRTYEGKTLWAKLKDFIRALIIKATNGEPTWLDAALMSSNDVLQAMRQDPANFDAASQVLALSAQGSLQNLDTETLFALAPAQNTVTQKIKTFAADKTLDNAPRWLSVAPLHTLVQTLGKQIPQIRKLAMHLEESEYISNDLINQAYDYYKKVGAFGTKITDAINRAAATASFYRVNPMEPMLDQEWVPEDKATKAEKLQVAQERWAAAGMERSTGKSFIAAYTEARAAYTAIGNKDAKDMYGAMVNFMRTVREREKNNLLAYIEQTTVGNPALREQLMQRFNATFKNIAGAYWPLNRVGDFRMEFTDLDGTRVVKHYESASALRADKEMYVKNGVEPSSFWESYKDRRPRGEVAIPMELMQQLSASVYNQKMSEADPSNPNAITEAQTEAQEIVDEMNQIWLRWQPETSALKNSVQRKNVKGFDENMMLSFLDYTRKHAANIAWSEQGRKIEGTIKSLADEITAQRKEGQDVTFKGIVLVDLRKRLQAIRDTKAGPIASTIGKLGTAYYMTSPSIALVQMTQLPILTFPKLATKYGSVGKAATAMLRGVQNAFSKDFTKKAIFGDIAVNTLHDQLRETVNEDNRPLPEAKDKMLGDRLYDDAYIEREFKRLTPKQQKLFVLREALARNLLDISAAHEAYALTQGKNPNGAINRAFNFAMQPMKLSEMASRKAAILATMELAQGEKKTFKGIMNNVSEVVNDTLYSYSKANKPAVLQGGAARVLMMFQWYRIMTALRIGLLFKRSIAAETPEVKAAARKEFVGIMGMTTLLAGTMGLPLAKIVFAALDALADDDEPRDSELEFRNWAAERLGPQWGEVFTHGLPTLAGVDISKRIGLGDLYGAQSEPPPRLHGRELAMWWAANQLGPVFGIVQGGFQGYDLMSRGEYLKGLEASMPKPLRDGLKAARTFEEGDVKTLTGRRTLGAEEITADALPLMALGFNPSEVAQATKNNMSKARLSTAISERRGSVIDAMVKAIQGEGDLDKARAMLIGYNKKMPRFAVSGGDIRSALVRGIKEDLGVNSRRDRLIELQYGL